jgi:hypothetical protein
LGVSVPVVKESKIPQISGATVGAYVQEASGDYVKRNFKEQP